MEGVIIDCQTNSWHLNGDRVLGYGYVAKDFGLDRTTRPGRRPLGDTRSDYQLNGKNQ
jgi:hypothetical protein